MCRLLLYFVYMFVVMLIFSILCMFVFMRVDEQATQDPGVQQIEVAEQELIEGNLCP
jgi:beta-lactam-binding protein with PASTA domain